MIRVYLYNSDGAILNDPERSSEHFKSISISTMWPKGYGTLTATVDRDIFTTWLLGIGTRIVVREGQRSIYDGRLQAPALSWGDNESQARLTAQGWYIILNERTIRKRWIDQQSISRFEWLSGADQDDLQTSPIVEKRDKDQFLRISIRPKDTTLAVTDWYEEIYWTPTGDIHKVALDYSYRTGEGFDVFIIGGSTTTESTTNINSATPSSGSISTTFTQGSTPSWILRTAPEQATIYDQNDWVAYTNVVTYMEYDSNHSVSTPTYSIDEIVEDVLVIARGSELSADMSEIGGSSTVLDNFITRDDGYQKASEIIEDLAAFSDASQNTYGLAVWDGDQSSDGLPQCYFAARTVTDYEYDISARDSYVLSYQVEYSDSELYNWVTVKWSDEKGLVDYLDPDDDSDLKDTDSITDYGERHSPTVDAGETTQSDAKQMAQRYLAYHKDPLYKGSITIQGQIKTKGGIMAPASMVRAGHRVRVRELGATLFIRETRYDVDTDTCTIIPDVPGDDITY
jgi:hypothetical protein